MTLFPLAACRGYLDPWVGLGQTELQVQTEGRENRGRRVRGGSPRPKCERRPVDPRLDGFREKYRKHHVANPWLHLAGINVDSISVESSWQWLEARRRLVLDADFVRVGESRARRIEFPISHMPRCPFSFKFKLVDFGTRLVHSIDMPKETLPSPNLASHQAPKTW